MRSITAAIAALMFVAVIWIVTGTLESRVPEGDRLVQFVTVTDGVPTSTVADEELHLWRDHTSLFETVVARQLAVEAGLNDPRHAAGLMKGARPLVVNGRLKPGVTIDMANRQLAALLVASRRLDPQRFKVRTSWAVRPLHVPKPART
jgi:hypothetical protein